MVIKQLRETRDTIDLDQSVSQMFRHSGTGTVHQEKESRQAKLGLNKGAHRRFCFWRSSGGRPGGSDHVTIQSGQQQNKERGLWMEL